MSTNKLYFSLIFSLSIGLFSVPVTATDYSVHRNSNHHYNNRHDSHRHSDYSPGYRINLSYGPVTSFNRSIGPVTSIGSRQQFYNRAYHNQYNHRNYYTNSSHYRDHSYNRDHKFSNKHQNIGCAGNCSHDEHSKKQLNSRTHHNDFQAVYNKGYRNGHHDSHNLRSIHPNLYRH